MPTETTPQPRFSLPIVPRYAEIDQQGVVFNAHYLTWFDEACTAYLDHIGVTYPSLIEAGIDFQVVHTELDYAAPVRWRDDVAVGVRCARVGSSSFTLAFEVWRRTPDGDVPVVTGHTVYVVVATSDGRKRELPESLRAALSTGG